MALASVCYNHDDRRAEFKCFDCKPVFTCQNNGKMHRCVDTQPVKYFSSDCVVKYCEECSTQIHSLEVFRLHKCIPVEKVDQRRLSQDVSDIEQLVAVETGLLDEVLTTLRYNEQQEREMLEQAHKRLHEIQECHRKVDKALLYLSKVSSVVNQICSDSTATVSTPVAPSENTITKIALGIPAIPGDELPVSVLGSLNKNGCFWMVKKGTDEETKITKLESEIRDYFQDHQMSPAVISDGCVCTAMAKSRLSRNDFWRVRVEKLTSGALVKIRYLDHGMQQDIPIESLVELPAVFKQIPFQAMECCLFPYSEDVSLPYEAKWCFKDLTHGKNLMAKINAKVIPPHGRTMFYVHLTCVGPPPLNVNLKVKTLLNEQTLAEEDRPVKPINTAEQAAATTLVELSHADSTTSPLQDNVATTLPEEGSVVENAVNGKESSSSSEERTNVTSEPQADSQGEAKPSKPKEDQIQLFEESLIEIAHHCVTEVPKSGAAEGIPLPFTGTNQVAENATIKILKPKPKTPEDAEHSNPEVPKHGAALTTTPEEYVPVGFINEKLYTAIHEKCNANAVSMRSLLAYARFFLIKCDIGQLIEAIKKNTWCCLDGGLANTMNCVYKDQQAKNNRPVFIAFAYRRNVSCLARMASSVKYGAPHCSVVSPGIHWSKMCKGEFSLEWYYVYKVHINSLDPQVKRINTRCYIELNWEKGAELASRFERMKVSKSRYSILEEVVRHYRHNTKISLQSSHEDLTAPEEPIENERGHQGTTEHVATGEVTHKVSSDVLDGTMGGSQEEVYSQEFSSQEDWESDLGTKPTQVAAIYSSVSSPSASQDSTGDAEGSGQGSIVEMDGSYIAVAEEVVHDSPVEINDRVVTQSDAEPCDILKTNGFAFTDVQSDSLESSDGETRANRACAMEVTVDGVTSVPTPKTDETGRDATELPEQSSIPSDGTTAVEDDKVTTSEYDAQEVSDVASSSNVACHSVAVETVENDSEGASGAEQDTVTPEETLVDVAQFPGIKFADSVYTEYDGCASEVWQETCPDNSDSSIKEGASDNTLAPTQSWEVNDTVSSDVHQAQLTSNEENGVDSTTDSLGNSHTLYSTAQVSQTYSGGFYAVQPPESPTSTVPDIELRAHPTAVEGMASDHYPHTRISGEDIGEAISKETEVGSESQSVTKGSGVGGRQETDEPTCYMDQMSFSKGLDSGDAKPDTRQQTTTFPDETVKGSEEDISGYQFPNELTSGEGSSSSLSSVENESTSCKSGSQENVTLEGVSVEIEQPEDEEVVVGFLPVEPGCSYRVFLKGVLGDDGLFWARIIRNREEQVTFTHFIASMGRVVEKKNENITSVHLMKFCCLVKNSTKSLFMRFKRVLILKVLSFSTAEVRLVDSGELKRVRVSQLRELDSEFQMDYPPQAFECHLQKRVNQKDKARYNKMVENEGKVAIFVRDITGETAEVEISCFDEDDG